MEIIVRVGQRKGRTEVVGKMSLGLRSTHNADGRYTRALAWDAEGRVYETAPRGWRVARYNGR